MIVDTSVVAAILFKEDDAPLFRSKIAAADQCLISVASVLESVLVNSANRPNQTIHPVLDLLRLLAVEQVEVDTEQMELAASAFLRYGKGRHPARLNFGDCFSYALAKSLDMPLLFKGDDFSKTDIRIA